jgi:hypothetical protein
MWRKTVIRRICKYLPLTPQTTAVLEHDIQTDFGGNALVDQTGDRSQDAVGNNGTMEKQVIDVQSQRQRKSKAKILVERTKKNDLPEPDEDFTE